MQENKWRLTMVAILNEGLKKNKLFSLCLFVFLRTWNTSGDFNGNLFQKSMLEASEADAWAPRSLTRVQVNEDVIGSFTLQSGKDSCLELFALWKSDEVEEQNRRTDAAWFPQYAEVEEVVLTGVLLTCSDSLALCNLHLQSKHKNRSKIHFLTIFHAFWGKSPTNKDPATQRQVQSYQAEHSAPRLGKTFLSSSLAQCSSPP